MQTRAPASRSSQFRVLADIHRQRLIDLAARVRCDDLRRELTRMADANHIELLAWMDEELDP